mmetsp:Transcript_15742/g.23704  ORF Transcript_15742/g.23704 Transcript_15742/m.23704 type:complete len:463 (+) Transcript_15742:36-1424(+)
MASKGVRNGVAVALGAIFILNLIGIIEFSKLRELKGTAVRESLRSNRILRNPSHFIRSQRRASLAARAFVPGVTRLKVTDEKYQKLPDCPDIIWDAKGIDLEQLPSQVDTNFPATLDANEIGISKDMTSEQQLKMIALKREEILRTLQESGAVHLQGLPIATDTEGYRQVLQTLGLIACKDPLAARKSLDNEIKKVVPNTAALGLHHDRSDYAPRNVLYDEEILAPKMPWYSAFVCFKQASEGGEFRILDAQRFVRELDRDIVKRLYEKGIRSAEVYGLWLPQSVFNMFAGWLIKVFPEETKWKWSSLVNPDFEIRSFFKAPPEGWSDISSPPQILADIWRCEVLLSEQSPLNRHPKTGEVVWFNNIHLWEGDKAQWKPKFKHSLGARSKAVYGDGSPIADADLDQIVKLTEDIEVKILMEPGDVILVDNYRTLHGREKFTNSRNNTRLHAVTFAQQFQDMP